jgi:hypothetical protein
MPSRPTRSPAFEVAGFRLVVSWSAPAARLGGRGRDGRSP